MADVSRLVSYLRENPAARSEPLEDLSRQFDLSPEMVELALRALPKSDTVAEAGDLAPGLPVKRRTSFYGGLSRLVRRPIGQILPWTIGLAAALIFGSKALAPAAFPSISGAVVLASALVSLSMVWGSPGYRTLLWSSLLPPLCFGLFVASLGKPDGLPFFVFGAPFLWFMHLALAVPTSLWSGWRRVREEKKRRESLSRQEMLSRLFEIRKILKGVESPGARKVDPKWRDEFRRRPELWSLGLGSASGLVTGLSFLALNPGGRTLVPGQIQPGDMNYLAIFALTWVAIVVCVFGSELMVGGASENIPRALTAAVAFKAGDSLIALLRVGPPEIIQQSLRPIGIISGLVGVVVTVLVGYSASRLSERIKERRLRSENNPEALVQEMVDLEYRLRPQSVKVTALVVDVAGSTRMKADADPYEAEWSFREYQSRVAVAAAESGGAVISTAGDGAVMSFANPSNALRAAGDIMRSISEFNAVANLLPDPFVLRIGIHSGEVMGSLGEVQFTSVIDIAAHVEASAPRGGIAITESAKALLPELKGLEAGAVVDGHQTWVMGSGGPQFQLPGGSLAPSVQ